MKVKDLISYLEKIDGETLVCVYKEYDEYFKVTDFDYSKYTEKEDGISKDKDCIIIF